MLTHPDVPYPHVPSAPLVVVDRFVLRLLHAWQAACLRAERPDRFVPYY